MKEKNKVIVCSLPDYEDLVAELYLDGQFIGLISQEEQRGLYKFESNCLEGNIVFDLNSLLEILQIAASKLAAVG